MKKFVVGAVLALVLTVAALFAQETVTVTTPVVTTATSQQVRYIGFDLANSRIVVEVVANTGVLTVASYDSLGLTVNGVRTAATPTGATLLNSVNISNNTTTSLVKRVYQRLQADGVIAAGSITGTPQ